MIVALIWTGSSVTYLLGVMVAARILHIRRYREFVAWRNEAPDENTIRYMEYGIIEKPRKEYTFWQFLRHVNLKAPRSLCFLWPFMGPFYAIKRFCFPENLPIADHVKIDELEKLL